MCYLKIFLPYVWVSVINWQQIPHFCNHDIANQRLTDDILHVSLAKGYPFLDEQLLQVQQVRFVTLGPLRRA